MLKKRILLLILVSGVIVRILLVLTIPNMQVSDGFLYKQLAYNLALTGKYEFSGYRAYTTPGYPFFLSLFYYAGINADVYIKLMQALLSAASVYILYKIAGKYFNETISMLAAFLLAFNLNQAAYSCLFFSETIFTFFLLVFTWLNIERKNALRILLMSICLSWMVMMKPHFILLSVLIVMFIGRLKKDWKSYIIIYSVCLLIITGWILRNHNVLGRYVFSTNNKVNMFISNNAHATGNYNEFGLRADLAEIEQQDYYKKMLEDDPIPLSRLPDLLFKKLWYIYCTDADSLRYWIVQGIDNEQIKEKVLKWRWLCLAEYIITIAGLFMYAIGIASRKLKLKILFILPALFITLVHLIYFGNARFHYPSMPFLFTLSACGWYWLFKKEDHPVAIT
jgi:4-amino-4-deoxy-L-arabinose transferase-like glycosyltransferase